MYVERSAVDSPLHYILTSHSLDNVFDYCNRKYEFLSMYDKRPERESGFAADVGTALHEGTQSYLKAKNNGESEDVALTKAYFSLMQWYPWDREDEQSTSARSFDNTNLLLYKIIRNPVWDEWDLVQVGPEKRWAVEVPFRIRHTSVGEFTVKNTGMRAMLATQGKIDMVMVHKDTGAIATFDLKTTIHPDELIEPHFKYSGQQVGYSQVVHSLLGQEVSEFKVYYVIAQFSASYEPKVWVLPFDKDQEAIDEYWLTKQERLLRMKYYAESGWFPRTNGGCHAWGKTCAFFDICASRDPYFVRRWFDTIDSEPQVGYDYWVDLEV